MESGSNLRNEGVGPPDGGKSTAEMVSILDGRQIFSLNRKDMNRFMPALKCSSTTAKARPSTQIAVRGKAGWR
jgi:hypothetical protein